MSTAEQPEPVGTSVLGDLEPFEWSTRDSVAYEVALEVLGEMVAVCSEEIWAEEHAEHPDPEKLRQAREAQAEYARQRKTLRLTDRGEIARVSREYGAILKQRHTSAGE